MAVVVAQLVERSALIPEIHGSNPVFSSNSIKDYIEKTKKRLRNAQF